MENAPALEAAAEDAAARARARDARTSPQTGCAAGDEAPAPSRSVLLVVFATILIDFVGFSVLIPILPLFAERLGATPVQVALLLALYALAQLLFSPVWGWVSDRIGRRPVILVSLFGTMLSFLGLTLADSIPALYAARVIAGFFAATIGTAQAVVTDVTRPEDRARGMAAIGAAFGAGMIVGPMLGGLLSAAGAKVPFFAVALLAAGNFGLAFWRLPESRPRSLAAPGWFEFWHALVPTPVRLVAAVHERRIALFLYLFFHLFTAFAVLEALITLYVGRRFGASMLDVGLLFAWIGLVLVLTQAVALRRLVRRIDEAELVALGLAAMAVGLSVLPVLPGFGWFYAAGALIAFGNGIAIPSFTSLYSKACRVERAGELLGQSQAMATTGRIVGPVCGGLLMESVAPGAPFLAAGAMMIAALAIFRTARGALVVPEIRGSAQAPDGRAQRVVGERSSSA
jgi:multidrug resistance protein